MTQCSFLSETTSPSSSSATTAATTSYFVRRFVTIGLLPPPLYRGCSHPPCHSAGHSGHRNGDTPSSPHQGLSGREMRGSEPGDKGNELLLLLDSLR
ncbi:hypothetical protein E2562_013856 [Oryza meyeriana var. granulata]|uniref:Uncharacterized protein n=1 Tax=Oryza meyeriana var. granulata TaxID=110450 RepID=A0A6G1F8E2_9ORYZ|nr:hypothetical protein E2562_013856 [Oryza meyeriana var. granulata]